MDAYESLRILPLVLHGHVCLLQCASWGKKRTSAVYIYCLLLIVIECTYFCIGDGNSKHYLVASQDIDIQQRLREIPGVCVCVVVYVRTYVYIHTYICTCAHVISCSIFLFRCSSSAYC